MIKAQRSILSISFAILVLCLAFSVASVPAQAQAMNAGSVSGVVLDPNGAIVANVTVNISNTITEYKRTANTDMEDTPGQNPFADWPTRGGEVSHRATSNNSTTG